MKKKIKRSDKFYVYIAQCANGMYYSGSTNNPEDRIERHNKGHGAKSLRGKLPVKLVYTKEYGYYMNVLHAERNLKKLTRAQKEELIRIYEKNKASP
jgi:putative endonuclease